MNFIATNTITGIIKTTKIFFGITISFFYWTSERKGLEVGRWLFLLPVSIILFEKRALMLNNVLLILYSNFQRSLVIEGLIIVFVSIMSDRHIFQLSLFSLIMIFTLLKERRKEEEEEEKEPILPIRKEKDDVPRLIRKNRRKKTNKNLLF